MDLFCKNKLLKTFLKFHENTFNGVLFKYSFWPIRTPIFFHKSCSMERLLSTFLPFVT